MKLAKHFVLQELDFFSAHDDFVGRAPWPAADPPVGLFEHRKSLTRGPARTRASAPRFWLRLGCSVGQAILPAAAFQAALVAAMLPCGAALQAAAPISSALFEPHCSAAAARLETGQQDTILPHYQ
jgi:hypothetical protein